MRFGHETDARVCFDSTTRSSALRRKESDYDKNTLRTRKLRIDKAGRNGLALPDSCEYKGLEGMDDIGTE